MTSHLLSRMIVVLTLCAFWSPASAEADPARWTHDSKKFALAIPAGFCSATETMRPFAEEIARVDRQNHTHMVLVDCEATDQPDRWIVVKSPKNITGSRVPSRAAFVREIKKMKLPGLKDLIQDAGSSAGDDFAKEMEQMVGESTAIRPAFRPLAVDDNAVYIGGFITYQEFINSIQRRRDEKEPKETEQQQISLPSDWH